VYEEIEADPHAIPQAFAVVILTAVLAGLGQGSLAGIFLGIACSILIWSVVTGLVWSVGVLVAGSGSEFPRLLRCLGFAYIWPALLVGASLPYLGRLLLWGGLLLYLGSLLLATRQVLRIPTGRAALVCAIALGFPLLVVGLIRIVG
jgi:hypothetical protein